MMLKQIFQSRSKDHPSHILIFLNLPYLTAKLDETALKKKELPVFFQLESFADELLLIPTHYSICYTICLPSENWIDKI